MGIYKAGHSADACGQLSDSFSTQLGSHSLCGGGTSSVSLYYKPQEQGLLLDSFDDKTDLLVVIYDEPTGHQGNSVEIKTAQDDG